MGEVPTLVGAIFLAVLVGWAAGKAASGRAPAGLMRTNVDGHDVPAVLGIGILLGAVIAVVWFSLWATEASDDICGRVGPCWMWVDLTPWRQVGVTLIPVVGMFLVGLWDDFRGDERPRGFAGHLGALKGGAITGGLVKMVGGVIVGLTTALAFGNYGLEEPVQLFLMAGCIALGANLLNLLDRAPGRAIKVFLVLALIPALFLYRWWFLVAGTLGAALGVLRLDLKAGGMLGDAGANALGAMSGFGLAILVISRGPGSSGHLRLLALTLVLLGLNLMSEKISFSRVIEQTPWLARLDHLGRK